MSEERRLNVNLKPMLKKVEFSTKKTLSTTMIYSQYRTLIKGSGLEFDGFTRFVEGSDARKIDWVASLRFNELYERSYVEERNLTIYFLIDTSGKMVFGSTEKLKCEYAAEVVASLASPIIESDNLLAFSLFSDSIVQSQKSGKGLKQFHALEKALTDPNNYGGKFDFEKALKFVMVVLQPRGILVIFSDFVGDRKPWESYFKIMCQKYEVIAVIIRDPRDFEMPPGAGQFMLEDPFSNKSMLVDTTKVAFEYKKEAQRDYKGLCDFFTKLSIDYVLLRTDKPFADPIRTFFERRRMRWK